MSRFRTDVILKIVPGGFETVGKISYHSDYLGRRVDIPTGFFTDLASVPRLLRSIVPVATGKNRKAAVVHDFLCDPLIQAMMGITQKDADAVWKEALEHLGVWKVASAPLWAGVRAFQYIKGREWRL